MSNAQNDIEELVYKILERYEEKKASKQIAAILQEIAKGGSYREIYNFARSIGLGDIFKEVIEKQNFVINMDEYDEIAKGFMSVIRKYAEDINDLAELAQKGINEALGIRIKPQRVKLNPKAYDEILDILFRGDVKPEELYKIEGLNETLLKFASELTDEIIRANAEIQTKSGFNIVLVRRYDDVGIHDYSKYADASKRKTIRGAKVCSFCKEREGAFPYFEIDRYSPIWQRHKGCSCSIDYINNGITKRVNNYIKV